MSDQKLEILIKPVDELTPEEKSRTAEIDRLCFEGQDMGIEWSPTDWIVMGLLDGVIVSQIFLLTREVDVAGQKILVGGLGGVATHPEYRRRGCAGLLLQASERFFRSLSLPFGILVCAEEKKDYYAGFGWVEIANKTIFQNRGKDQVMEGVMMVLPLTDQPWPQGVLNLNGKPW